MTSRHTHLARGLHLYGRMFLSKEFRDRALRFKTSDRPAVPCLTSDKWGDVLALLNRVEGGRIVCFDPEKDAIAVVETSAPSAASPSDSSESLSVHRDVSVSMFIDSITAIDSLGRKNILTVSASDLTSV